MAGLASDSGCMRLGIMVLVASIGLLGVGSTADFEADISLRENQVSRPKPKFFKGQNHEGRSSRGNVLSVPESDPVDAILPPIPRVLVKTGRTSSIFVGSVMALLATLEDTGVLPPEGTAQANQLIHALIQLQSVLVKSDSLELKHYRLQAQDWYQAQNTGTIAWSIEKKGLTSHLLEALLRYDPTPPLWEREEITRVFQSFNVSRADWDLIDDVFTRAEAVYQNRKASIHEVFAEWRARMPGR